MIDFMVIGLPRSGTTWAANWLTSGRVHCVHDPMRLAPREGWAELAQRGKISGVACTVAWMWPEWLNAHPARKLVLRRAPVEVAASLAKLGLPAAIPDAKQRLDAVRGMHLDWDCLFDPALAETAWKHLTGRPFDAARHAVLREMRIEPKFEGLTVRPEAARRLVADLRAVLKGA